MRRQMRMVAWMQLGFPFMVIYKDLRSLRVNWLVFLLRQWSMKKINEIRQKNQQEERLAAVVWTVEFSFLKEWLQPILYIYTSWRLWDIGETRLRLGLRLSPGSDGCGTSLTSFSSSPLTVHFPCIAGNKNDNDPTPIFRWLTKSFLNSHWRWFHTGKKWFHLPRYHDSGFHLFTKIKSK